MSHGVSTVLGLVANTGIVVDDDGGVFDALLLHPDRILRFDMRRCFVLGVFTCWKPLLSAQLLLGCRPQRIFVRISLAVVPLLPTSQLLYTWRQIGNGVAVFTEELADRFISFLPLWEAVKNSFCPFGAAFGSAFEAS